jgi:hypothetical protein
MSEERKMILQMLKDGEISVDEAERLIEAVTDSPIDEGTVKPGGGMAPKRISVKVTQGEKTRVNIKIPFSLLRTAIKLGKTAGLIGALSTKSKQGELNEEIMDTIKAIDPDEILSSLSEGAISLPHTIIDAVDEDSGQSVKIVLE